MTPVYCTGLLYQIQLTGTDKIELNSHKTIYQTVKSLTQAPTTMLTITRLSNYTDDVNRSPVYRCLTMVVVVLTMLLVMYVWHVTTPLRQHLELGC